MIEAFVLLNDARPGREASIVFGGVAGTIVAREAGEVSRTWRCRPPGKVVLSRLTISPTNPATRWSLGLRPSYRPISRRPCSGSGCSGRGPGSGRLLESRVRGRAYAGPLRLGQMPQSRVRSFVRVQGRHRSGRCLSGEFAFSGALAFGGDPLALYARLRGLAQAGHGAFVDYGTSRILSFRPRFSFRWKMVCQSQDEGHCAAVPTSREMHKIAVRLKASEKERAEHLAIADLIRNDVGRVARPAR
jgi:hypothetical protein